MNKFFLLYINNSTTNKISNYLKYLRNKIFLTVVHIVINNGSNNGDIHRLEILRLKLQNLSEKCVNIKSTYFIP